MIDFILFGCLLVILIVLLILIIRQTNRVRREALERIIKEINSTCTNCGSSLRTNYFYKGKHLSHCNMCGCGFKPLKLFHNNEGEPYALNITYNPLNNVKIDTKYVPNEHLEVRNCPNCGSHSFYSDDGWGSPNEDYGIFRKCNSCGYSEYDEVSDGRLKRKFTQDNKDTF